MRRIVVVLILALIGAGLAGQFVGANGVKVDNTAMKSSTLRGELVAIGQSASFACYISALLNMNTSNTASVFGAAGAATWTNVRVDGLSIEDYVVKNYDWIATKAQLAEARLEYVNDLQNAAARTNNSCGLTASQALDTMPKSFVDAQLRANAASLELIKHLPGILPLNVATANAFYKAHKSSYDTICISVAYIPAASQVAFSKDQQAGMSVSDLAHKYSVDPSAAKGGEYGCYGPTSSSYATVRDYTYGNPLNQYPTQPREAQTSSGIFLVYVAPTKRTPNTFANSATQVVADMRARNAAVASSAQARILQAAHVAIDPAFAQWSLASLTAVASAKPSTAVTPNAGVGLGF